MVLELKQRRVECFARHREVEYNLGYPAGRNAPAAIIPDSALRKREPASKCFLAAVMPPDIIQRLDVVNNGHVDFTRHIEPFLTETLSPKGKTNNFYFWDLTSIVDIVHRRAMKIDPDDTGMFAVDVGRRLRLVRLAHGLNQASFSARAGLGQPKYSEFENGTRRLSLNAAMSIHGAFGLSLDYMYLGDRSGLNRRLLQQIQDVEAELPQSPPAVDKCDA